MINIFKELFSSKNLKRAGITMLFSNPNLSGADYARICESLKMLDSTVNEEKQAEMKMKKVSYAV